MKIKARSIMGTEIPLVQHETKPLQLTYGFYNTTKSLDEARYHFERVKELTIKLSMVENSAYRLANSIKKTQKRANALKTVSYTHLPVYHRGAPSDPSAPGRHREVPDHDPEICLLYTSRCV